MLWIDRSTSSGNANVDRVVDGVDGEANTDAQPLDMGLWLNPAVCMENGAGSACSGLLLLLGSFMPPHSSTLQSSSASRSIISMNDPCADSCSATPLLRGRSCKVDARACASSTLETLLPPFPLSLRFACCCHCRRRTCGGGEAVTRSEYGVEVDLDFGLRRSTRPPRPSSASLTSPSFSLSSLLLPLPRNEMGRVVARGRCTKGAWSMVSRVPASKVGAKWADHPTPAVFADKSSC